MKKIILFLFIILFFSSNAQSLTLDTFIGGNEETSGIKIIDKTVKETSEEISKKAEDKINKVSQETEQKVDEKIAKADILINKAEKQLNFFDQIQKRIVAYMNIGIGIIVISLFLILLMILPIWKLQRVIKNTKNSNLTLNSEDIKSFKQEIVALRNEIRQLKNNKLQ